jgi:hypothetical protein
VRNWEYRRIFAGRCRPTRSEVEELLALCAAIDRKETGASSIPAGYTYFGQFIDHDLSLLAQNAEPPRVEQIDDAIDVGDLTLARKPALDLDSVYGGGLDDSVVPFDRESGRFVVGTTGFGDDRDLPRDPAFRALIADERNDENPLVAQVQVLFMNLHNRIAETLQGDGEAIYRAARAEAIKIYQYLALHDFLNKLVRPEVDATIVIDGRGRLTSTDRASPKLAIEASDAALRLHSLVREVYHLNDRDDSFELETLLALTGRGAGHGPPASPPLLKHEHELDWRFFFPFADYPAFGGTRCQFAMRLSAFVNHVLRSVPDGRGGRVDMLERNILRGLVHGLPSGQQAIAELTGRPELSDVVRDIGLSVLDAGRAPVLDRLSARNSIRRDTPLWLYLMFEAPDGCQFGPLGGWLLADTLLTAALSADVCLPDPRDPNPNQLFRDVARMAEGHGVVTIEDVIAYTYRYQLSP